MNKTTFKKLVLSLGLAAVAPLTAFAAPDPNFHIYLMFGQSNMEGQGQISSQDQQVPADLLAMHADDSCTVDGASYGEWRPATPPLIRCYNVAHSFNNGGLGPGDYFGRTMLENSGPGVKVGLVGAAYQGRPIEFFMNPCAADCNQQNLPLGNGGYPWLLDLAKKAQQDGVIKGIIFHQGESNSGDSSWPGKVNQVVTSLRNDLGLNANDVPFIAGEMVPGACCTGHNAQVQRIPSTVTNGHYVSASGLSARDQYHFDAESYREIGRRYADKMLELIDVSGGPVDCGTQDGNPICCSISADPDEDGWGTQNDGEMCIVTPETAGYVPPNPPDVAAAINVGSSQAAPYQGIYYKADRDFDDGTANATGDTISGSEGSAMFQSERYGDFTYDIPLSNGSYTVELHFAELYQEQAGAREFNVSVEGSSAISNLDLYQVAGHDVAYSVGPIDTTVNDSSLTIQVSTVTDNGTLSGILVRTAELASSSSSNVPSSSSSSSVISSSSSVSSSSSSQSGTTTGGSTHWMLILLLTPLAMIRRK